MKRVFSNPVAAVVVGFGLRLFFVLRFPANSGDTVLYEQMATNWLRQRVYAMNVNGVVTPVDLRMPGYPAFLALVYALTGRTAESARLYVMLGQVLVDLVTCVITAALASLLASNLSDPRASKRVFAAAIWLAALCPFTANYTAVSLTEVFAVFFTAAALYYLVLLIFRIDQSTFRLNSLPSVSRRSVEYTAVGSGFLVGMGTLFRPETPLLLVAAALILFWLFLRRKSLLRWFGVAMLLSGACFAPLIPWGARNIITLNEPQFLAPKNSNLPGELVPYGFMAWEKTWLYRVRDCYLVPWKLNDEPIDVETIPERAFDTPAEKQRVSDLMEQYNNDLALNAEEDAAFAILAKERTQRHPLRTYLWLPAGRALAMWFTPRIELLPVSGVVFPLAQSWEDDPIDQGVTVAFFLLNIFYIVLALWGGWRLWGRKNLARGAIALFIVFILLRTAFLTTVEAPEPRYVLVCFPALIALAAQVFAKHKNETPSSSSLQTSS